MSEESQAGMYVSPIDRRVATTDGFVILFEANVPVKVPPLIQPQMLEYGILPVDGELPIDEPAEAPPPDPVGLKRIEKIMGVFALLAEENDTDNFTATQFPKAAAIKKLAGFQVPSKELKDLWLKFKAEQAAAASG